MPDIYLNPLSVSFRRTQDSPEETVSLFASWFCTEEMLNLTILTPYGASELVVTSMIGNFLFSAPLIPSLPQKS